MKKLSLWLLVVVVLAYPVYPWAIGLALERKINRQEQELTKSIPYISIVERSYRRGWYSSQQDITFEIFSGFTKALGSANKISDPPIAAPGSSPMAPGPLRFTIHNDIHHGPFLGGSGVGLAHIDTRFPMSEATRAELASVFGKQEPISVRTRLGLFGGGSTTISSPAFHDIAPSPAGEKLSSDGLDLQIDFSRHADHYTVKGGAPRFAVAGHDGSPQMLLRGLTIDADMHRLLRQLYTGNVKLGIAELSGGSGSSLFAMKDLSYGVGVSPRSELLDMALRFDVASMDTPKFNARDLHYDFTLANLHAETFARLQESLQDSLRAGSGDPAAYALGAMSEFRKYGLELLKYDPELRFDRVGFTTPDGSLSIKGFVRTNGLTAADLNAPSPLTMLPRLSADVQLSLSEKLMARFAASRAGGDANPDSQKLASQQLEALIAQGVVRRVNGDIVSHLEFRDSKLSANGKPVWPPGGMSPR